MPFITTPERIGFERGRQETLQEAIEWSLQTKFGPESLKIMPDIRQLKDNEVLRAIFRAIATAPTPDELRRLWAPESRP